MTSFYNSSFALLAYDLITSILCVSYTQQWILVLLRQLEMLSNSTLTCDLYIAQ